MSWMFVQGEKMLMNVLMIIKGHKTFQSSELGTSPRLHHLVEAILRYRSYTVQRLICHRSHSTSHRHSLSSWTPMVYPHNLKICKLEL